MALDPFPYGGGTTSCDGMWMGVPVVTLNGRTAVGRGGVSLLHQIGLSELVAKTPAEYLRIARGVMAADLGRACGIAGGGRARECWRHQLV